MAMNQQKRKSVLTQLGHKTELVQGSGSVWKKIKRTTRDARKILHKANTTINKARDATHSAVANIRAGINVLNPETLGAMAPFIDQSKINAFHQQLTSKLEPALQKATEYANLAKIPDSIAAYGIETKKKPEVEIKPTAPSSTSAEIIPGGAYASTGAQQGGGPFRPARLYKNRQHIKRYYNKGLQHALRAIKSILPQDAVQEADSEMEMPPTILTDETNDVIQSDAEAAVEGSGYLKDTANFPEFKKQIGVFSGLLADKIVDDLGSTLATDGRFSTALGKVITGFLRYYEEHNGEIPDEWWETKQKSTLRKHIYASGSGLTWKGVKKFTKRAWHTAKEAEKWLAENPEITKALASVM